MVAIAYIIFNRPSHTRETFAAIRAQKPDKLFIIADGPRTGHPSDVERCREVREIVEKIDWQCEVHRNYADTNLGLKRRVSSGLDWVFEQVDRAVILEDDCLPHHDFFEFCASMLEHYENDERVWVITGNNFQNGRSRGKAAYYFSKYPHCWGWATWRRAWRYYQDDMPFWPEWQSSKSWRQLNPRKAERNYWVNIFEKVRRNEFDSWAYPWMGCVWFHGGLTVTPNVNLVTNIGFGPEGTHTVVSEDVEGVATQALGQVTHPKQVKQDKVADRYVFDHVFNAGQPAGMRRILSLSRSLIVRLIRGGYEALH